MMTILLVIPSLNNADYQWDRGWHIFRLWIHIQAWRHAMNTLKDKIKELEREEIVNALRESNWVMARAARRLGITERMIGYKIKKLGIRKIFEREGEGKEL